MGNVCVNGRFAKDGFFYTITHPFWRSKSPDMISYGNKTGKKPAAKAIEGSDPVEVKPPQPVKIEEENKLPQPTKVEAVIIAKGEPQPPQTARTSEEVIAKDEKKTDQILKPENEKPEPVEDSKAKKLHNVKRTMSVGLQVDSVLRTKTGHLKEHFNLGHKLGHGQFGTTFLCVERKTGKEYACKSIAKRKLLTQEDVDDVRREIEIMHHLSGNPNVVSIKGAYEDAVAVHVVMELCTGGELFDRIVKRGHYSEKKAAELTRTIVGVIETCHSLGVMHRDLKPENFLFVNEDEDSPLKAIDFGLSMFFKPGETFTDVVGSPYYVAPEVLCKLYGPEADVWSAGVIIYILLCGVPPFWGESEQEIFKEVLHGDVDLTSDPWPKISDSAKDLVKKMLVRDPRKRLTAHQVLCHPWVQVDGVAPDKPLDSAVLTRLTQFSAMDKLKKMALRTQITAAISLSKSSRLALKRFGANLKESEIYDLMKAPTLHLNKIEKEDHLFRAFSYFDKDGSGYITQDELQKACEEFGIEDGQLEEMILEADQNNDGRIDYNEFVAMMQKGNADFGKKRYQNNFNIGFRRPCLFSNM
ncbi:UNVERIFIED_CONTAM: Calcium-dependent protein kinase [Sesamum latifolium]|uniref:non-specific serine/threonine protein kinase n=1 Tax=Sesamum latifolium TaxID=2727402 RepID=A0AAW2VB16_9LAMI